MDQAVSAYLIAQGALGVYAVGSTFAIWRLFVLLMKSQEARIESAKALSEAATSMNKIAEAVINRSPRGRT